MRPLRYSVNDTLDGCCDHRAIIPDEDLHRHAARILEQADALLFVRPGRAAQPYERELRVTKVLLVRPAQGAMCP